MNMLVSGAALLLAGVAFIVYDVVTFRDGMVSRLQVQAQIIGSNSVSALTFGDPSSAETTLGALSAASNVTAAGLYGPDGRLFASYPPGATGALPGSVSLASRVGTSWLVKPEITVIHPIVFQGNQAGAVFIRSDLSELQTRLRRYALIVGVVLIVSLVAAYSVSRTIQRAIAEPLSELAQVARRVSNDKDYSVRAAAVPDENEVAILVAAFNDMLGEIQRRDVSLQQSQSQLEDRVRARTSELALLNQELEAFSYSVSHDLRAPLRHVTGFVSLLEQHAGATLDDKERRYLNTISTAAQRMGRLIDDLLAFSRTSRAGFAKGPVSLQDAVREAQSDVLAHADTRDIVWTVHPLPTVLADRAMLKVVLVNLLSNAVKYTSTRPQARIEIGAVNDSSGEATIFVRDNGVGFDMQYAHKLFGVFQRLHSIEEFDGTGIGLATVHRIIERHGGRIWAEAKPDEGATFSFTLPTAPQPQNAAGTRLSNAARAE